MTRLVRLGLLAIMLWLLLPRAGWTQVQLGAEVVRERSTYHFDNPSTYDTSRLVPHFFEQHYVLDNRWLTASAGYRAGIDWRTTVGVTPVRRGLATDYDTFFDPGGVTWVSGTTGDARMHSFRVAQEVDLRRVGAVRLAGGYRLRVDLADFLAGDKTDTRNGSVVSRSVVTSPEHTSAQRHDVFVSGAHVTELSSQWEMRLSAEAAPAAITRLAIGLPEKYPGQTLVYRTTSLTATGRVELARTRTRWPVVFALQAGRAWNYRSAQRAERSHLALGVSLGKGW